MALRNLSLSSMRAIKFASKSLSINSRTVIERGYAASIEEPVDFVKQAFINQQRKFRDYLKELESIKIPLDPDNDKAVKEYADSLKSIRKKVGVPSFSEKLGSLLESACDNSSTIRSYLEEAKNIRIKLGIEDELGAEPLMFDALDAVEKKLGKPLTTTDQDGLEALSEQVDIINSKLGLDKVSLEDAEKQAELLLAQTEISAFRAQATEIMDTYKKRDGLEHINVDLSDLNPKPYI